MARARLTQLLSVLALAGLLALLAGCGDSNDDSSDSGSTSSVSAEDCTPDKLDTKSANTLTIATDSPAFPPYFEDNDPTNGKGFESATAYAIADQLGYGRSQVKWVVEAFNSSFAPGPKDFDFDLNQITITPQREQQVDFSSPYYEAKQAVVVARGSDAAGATSLDDLKSANIGVQIGTTSLEAVQDEIDPDNDPQVFDTSNDVVQALRNGAVDAIVTDVPTAFYLTAVQVPTATVVGQFAAPGGDQWGALLQKDSPLTDCVSFAIDELSDSGELGQIESTWISEKTNAPVID
jgi:polar amino acid transport system substrate-binding protein